LVSTALTSLPKARIIATAARVGDTGSLSAITVYGDSSKTGGAYGTTTRNYKIEAETDTSVILVVTAQNSNGSQPLPVTEYRSACRDIVINEMAIRLNQAQFQFNFDVP